MHWIETRRSLLRLRIAWINLLLALCEARMQRLQHRLTMAEIHGCALTMDEMKGDKGEVD